MFLTRRAVLAGCAATLATPALAQAQDRTEARARPRDGGPAEVIDDPRISRFDIGPQGAGWRVQLARPAVPPPPGGYPMIVALDGNATFPLFWHHLQQIAPEAPVVLAGLGHPVEGRFDLARRWDELTSPALVPPGVQDQMSGDHQTGGRDAFRDMIETDLLGRLDAELPLDPGKRMLYGHSLGGLFGLHMLFTRPGLFRALVVADPSTWWNSGEALREAGIFAGGVRAGGGAMAQPTDLLVMSGGSSPRIGSADRRSFTPGVVETLQGIAGLNVTYRPFPDLSHGGLIAPSVAEALALQLQITG
ncbi:alpha/beta hydrolase [Pseudooceanicola algae]|uniref:Acyl-CoA:diacylglycerol acyltransferase n=1 Tax=Pseudooceanicola algae TaxID=1537215 RepID=A0A418SB87_9RHOB|nr:alpha/beta hydrolase-fold protein [Pseudooceanicola algae]QPM91386.1 Ferri-bacillibactin esterase BesA [Pseudooceanicola algae]